MNVILTKGHLFSRQSLSALSKTSFAALLGIVVLCSIAPFETLVLVSILFAMLRTRFAASTLLVNRTLAYSIFAVCLALIYLSGITLLRSFIAPGWPRVFPGAFVLATLALFRPLRTRIHTKLPSV